MEARVWASHFSILPFHCVTWECLAFKADFSGCGLAGKMKAPSERGKNE